VNMMTSNRNSRTWLIFIACILFGLVLPSLWSQAASPASLPPRKLTPTIVPSRKTAGCAIELCVRFDPTWPWDEVPEQELETLVQWQDGLGGWHDIEGWRTELFDEIRGNVGRKTWWVSKEHFGTGPFRWVIYRQGSGELLATSESFYMPASAGGVTRTVVSLGS